MIEIGNRRKRGSSECFSDVFMKLVFRLFRIVVQNRFAPHIRTNIQSEQIYREIPLFSMQHSGNNRRDIVALARSLTTRNAEQIVVSSQRNVVHGNNRFGTIGRIVIIDFTRT